jgi:hypothetical protein
VRNLGEERRLRAFESRIFTNKRDEMQKGREKWIMRSYIDYIPRQIL